MLARQDDTSDIWTPGLNPAFRDAVHAKRRQERRSREVEQRRLKREYERRRAAKAAEEERRRLEDLSKLAAKDEAKARDVVDRLFWHKRKEERHKAISIIEEIADKHGFSVSIVRGPSRNRLVCACRREAIAEVVLKMPELSYVKIGKLFGKDHTTILYTARKMGVARVYD